MPGTSWALRRSCLQSQVRGGYIEARPPSTPFCSGLLPRWPMGPASLLASQGGVTGLIRLY